MRLHVHHVQILDYHPDFDAPEGPVKQSDQLQDKDCFSSWIRVFYRFEAYLVRHSSVVHEDSARRG